MKIRDTRKVYLIWNTEVEKMKIGISRNVKSRIRALRSIVGCELELYYATKFIGEFFELEGYMHEYFKDYRIMGEWFKIDKTIVLNVLKDAEMEYLECEIVKMFNGGLNATKIADKLGVSRTAVVKNLKSKGFHIKNKVNKAEKRVLEKAPTAEEFFKKQKEDVIKKDAVTKLNIAAMVARNNEKMQNKKLIQKEMSRRKAY